MEIQKNFGSERRARICWRSKHKDSNFRGPKREDSKFCVDRNVEIRVSGGQEHGRLRIYFCCFDVMSVLSLSN